MQMANFREMGYEEDAHYPVVYFGRPSDLLLRLWESDELRCYLHAYPDTRADRSYSPSMKPWLHGQVLRAVPRRSSQRLQLPRPRLRVHPPDGLHPLRADDDRWYGSDTRSYTGAQYIREKGEQLFLDLCAIADVSPEDVLTHDDNSIGAQYFIKDAGADFWFNVERNSVTAYQHMIATADQYHPPGHEYPIQAWCAEMYMQQFETIRAGFTPVAAELMQFYWANAPRRGLGRATPISTTPASPRRTVATSARSPGSRPRSARTSRCRPSRPRTATCS